MHSCWLKGSDILTTNRHCHNRQFSPSHPEPHHRNPKEHSCADRCARRAPGQLMALGSTVPLITACGEQIGTVVAQGCAAAAAGRTSQ